MHKCKKCNTHKTSNDFYKRKDRASGLYSWCKSCFNVWISKRTVDRKSEWVDRKGAKCVDCGIKHNHKNTAIFDFHHINKKTKSADWKKVRFYSFEKAEEELNKCIILCSNCHRLRHSGKQ